jgi:hypothetical protein
LARTKYGGPTPVCGTGGYAVRQVCGMAGLTVEENYSILLEDIQTTFYQSAKQYKEKETVDLVKLQGTSRPKQTRKQKSKPNIFEQEMFSTANPIDNFQGEIKQYLDQETEDKDIKILDYWKG